MSDLINQPSAAPTRKMTAVGINSIAVPPIAAVIVSQIPGVSETCGSEVAAGMIVLVTGWIQGAVTFINGYLVKNRAP